MKMFPWILSLLLLVTACSKPAEESAGAAESTETDSTPFVLEDAFAKAKAENKVILLEFTGSDWCPPCKMLEREVLSKPEFQAYIETNLIFGKLDFPRSKPQSEAVKNNNEELSARFQVNAFPTLILLKSDGTELWREEGFGGGTPKDLIAQIEAKRN